MISWLEKNPIISWTITIVIATIIFYLSSKTSDDLSGVPKVSFFPEVYHFTIFFFLAFFLLISMVKGKQTILIIFAMIIAILFGFVDELHQYLIPGRDAELSDIIFNTSGIILSSFIYFLRIKFNGSDRI
tara:strand:- start:234 stop:623 length:390 start_codon:yes stop_codon:yes gene_type:complete